MIVLIFVMLPRELGRLAEVRRRMHITGGTYSGKSRTGHVVFCGGHVHTDTVRGLHNSFWCSQIFPNKGKKLQLLVLKMFGFLPVILKILLVC